MTGREVELKCYDLSNGMMGMVGNIGRTLSINIDAVWHTSILLDDREYFYSDGLQCDAPEEVEKNYGMKAQKTICLGTCVRTPDEVKSFFESKKSYLNSNNYNLIHNNCNHFSNEFGKYLVNSSDDVVPEYILNQHDLIRQLPNGENMLAMLEAIGGNVQNPFRQMNVETLRNQLGQVIPGLAGAAAGTAGNDNNQLNKQFADILSSLGVGAKSTSAQVEAIRDPSIKSKFKSLLNEIPKQTRDQALKIIDQMCSNILEHVSNMKYRYIKDTSKSFSSVSSLPAAVDLITAVGWAYNSEESRYEFMVVNKTTLLNLSDVCKACKATLEETSTQTKTPEVSQLGELVHRFTQQTMNDPSTMNNMVRDLVGEGGLSRLVGSMQNDPQMNSLFETIRNDLLGGDTGASSSQVYEQVMNHPNFHNLVQEMAQPLLKNVLSAQNSQRAGNQSATVPSRSENDGGFTDKMKEGLKLLVEMGFEDNQKTRNALQKSDGDVTEAMRYLEED